GRSLYPEASFFGITEENFSFLLLPIIAWLGWIIYLSTFFFRKKFPEKSSLGGSIFMGVGGAIAYVFSAFLLIPLVVSLPILFGIGYWVYRSIFGHKCPKCSKWMNFHSDTITQATRSRSGKRKVTKKCTGCGYTNVSYETIPEVSDSSSSSGGGGSSSGGSSFSGFGGGSSGGGGSGRSW
ncbi:MAG: hypothetical protein V1843_02630, partial [bacterium]